MCRLCTLGQSRIAVINEFDMTMTAVGEFPVQSPVGSGYAFVERIDFLEIKELQVLLKKISLNQAIKLIGIRKAQ